MAEQAHPRRPQQLRVYLDNFMPRQSLKMFSAQDILRVLTGEGHIDVTLMRTTAKYKATPRSSWFWKLVEGLGQPTLARLLFFITGMRGLPAYGFGPGFFITLEENG